MKFRVFDYYILGNLADDMQTHGSPSLGLVIFSGKLRSCFGRLNIHGVATADFVTALQSVAEELAGAGVVVEADKAQ